MNISIKKIALLAIIIAAIAGCNKQASTTEKAVSAPVASAPVTTEEQPQSKSKVVKDENGKDIDIYLLNKNQMELYEDECFFYPNIDEKFRSVCEAFLDDPDNAFDYIFKGNRDNMYGGPDEEEVTQDEPEVKLSDLATVHGQYAIVNVYNNPVIKRGIGIKIISKVKELNVEEVIINDGDCVSPLGAQKPVKLNRNGSVIYKFFENSQTGIAPGSCDFDYGKTFDVTLKLNGYTFNGQIESTQQ